MGERLVIPHMIELVEDANRILDDLRGNLAQLTILGESLNVFSNSGVERLGAFPLDSAHIKKVTKLLHAIGVEPVERSHRSVGPYVALDRRDQLIKRWVARKSLNRIGTRPPILARSTVVPQHGRLRRLLPISGVRCRNAWPPSRRRRPRASGVRLDVRAAPYLG